MKTIELTLENRIELVKKWLLKSGIQSEDGGFYAWQDVDSETHSYLYSEITGYAITIMCFLHSITKDPVFMTGARHAAQWILQNALHPEGGVLTRSYVNNPDDHYAFERGNIYSFDSAMAAFGMLKLYRITADEEYLACAEKIINFLNSRMLKPEGGYYPIFDTKKGQPYEDMNKWSTQSGSFHCKLALCLCELSGIKKEVSYMESASRLIKSSLGNFYKNGRFITNMADNTSHLHPYSYTLEGMLYYTRLSKDGSHEDTIRSAFSWMAGLQEKDGGFPTQVSGDKKRIIPYQRCDIQAQVLRLSYFMKSDIDREMLVERFLGLQNMEGDYKGGFLFGFDEKGSFLNHCNAWCSMFALQALYLVSGRAKTDIVMDYLV